MGDKDGLYLAVASREREKWLESGENEVCGFVQHKKFFCAVNIDLRVLGINVIDAMEVD